MTDVISEHFKRFCFPIETEIVINKCWCRQLIKYGLKQQSEYSSLDKAILIKQHIYNWTWCILLSVGWSLEQIRQALVWFTRNNWVLLTVFQWGCKSVFHVKIIIKLWTSFLIKHMCGTCGSSQILFHCWCWSACWFGCVAVDLDASFLSGCILPHQKATPTSGCVCWCGCNSLLLLQNIHLYTITYPVTSLIHYDI